MVSVRSTSTWTCSQRGIFRQELIASAAALVQETLLVFTADTHTSLTGRWLLACKVKFTAMHMKRAPLLQVRVSDM